jgi:hypothetical protein
MSPCLHRSTVCRRSCGPCSCSSRHIVFVDHGTSRYLAHMPCALLAALLGAAGSKSQDTADAGGSDTDDDVLSDDGDDVAEVGATRTRPFTCVLLAATGKDTLTIDGPESVTSFDAARTMFKKATYHLNKALVRMSCVSCRVRVVSVSCPCRVWWYRVVSCHATMPRFWSRTLTIASLLRRPVAPHALRRTASLTAVPGDDML